MDEGQETQFIFCDVSRAFGRVWHDGIPYKMKQLGITGKLWNWFQDYMYIHGRIQRVVINGEMSSTITIKAGLPPNSILGPLMLIIYTMYMNDIVEQVYIDIRLYADDVHVSW